MIFLDIVAPYSSIKLDFREAKRLKFYLENQLYFKQLGQDDEKLLSKVIQTLEYSIQEYKEEKT